MLNNITPFEDLFNEAEQIQEFLNETCSENGADVTMRGNRLSAEIARTGKMVADAEYWLNRKKKSQVVNDLKELLEAVIKPSATAQNAIVEAACRDEQYLFTWCERLNKAATHELSWCVTKLSKIKAEMMLEGMKPREMQY